MSVPGGTIPHMPPVNDTGVLAGLTDIPWAELRHAYGSADDVPGILRAIADGDEETAKEAASELFGNIWHQGTVYQATVPAAPFLARLVAAGHRTATLTGLLGCIAESTDEYGIEPGGARAAVTAQGDLLLPLLADPDPEVRAMAAWALAQCPDMPGLIQALRDQWGSEASPDVRGQLLKAVSVVAPAQATPLATSVIAGAVPGRNAAERLIAAWCLVASGTPWTPSLREAATAWLAGGLDPAKNNWNHEEPFPGLLRDLAARGDLAVAVELAVTAIDQAQDPAARKAAVWAAEKLALEYRVPALALADVLARTAADAEAGLGALSLLRQFGPIPDAADAVCAVADRPGPDRTADEALACLLEWGDPRAPGLLARDLADRPFALRLTSDSFAGGPGKAVTIPFNRELLHAIRVLLAARRFDLNPRAGLFGATTTGRLSRNGLIQVLLVLESWGPAATAAIPEVTALIPDMPVNAGRALATIAGPVPAAVNALRTAAAPDADAYARVPAAIRLLRLTGDNGPLLAIAEECLTKGGRALGTAASAALEVDDPPVWLGPALAAALDQAAQPPADGATAVHLEARLTLARALWRVSGDAGPLVASITQVLQPPAPDTALAYFRGRAAKAACDLGPAAAPLLPVLLPLLGDPESCPLAAQAILGMDPAASARVPMEALVGHLVAAVATPGGRNQLLALALLSETSQHWPAASTATVREQLSGLAERPRRVVTFGSYDQIIRDDEALRAEIRRFLANGEKFSGAGAE